MREEREFSETIYQGRMIAEAFYVKLGRENLASPLFNHQAWYLHMKNRFKWSDKIEIDSKTQVVNPLSDAELDKSNLNRMSIFVYRLRYLIR